MSDALDFALAGGALEGGSDVLAGGSCGLEGGAHKKHHKRSAGKKSAGKKSAHKKSAGKKSAGKKSAGKKSAGKKSAGKKSAGKKSAGKKSAHKKSAHKKSAGKKSAGKKSAGKKASPSKKRTRVSMLDDEMRVQVGDRVVDVMGEAKLEPKSPKRARKSASPKRKSASPKRKPHPALAVWRKAVDQYFEGKERTKIPAKGTAGYRAIKKIYESML